MISSILCTSMPSCEFKQSHWSVKLFTVIGIVSLVAGSILLSIALQGKMRLLPYAITCFVQVITSFPAAYLVNKYYTLKQLSDVSDSIGKTAGEIDEATETITRENIALKATVEQMHQNVEERGAQVTRLTRNLQEIEQKLAQTEDDLTATFEATKADMRSVMDLLDDEDDFKLELEKLDQIEGHVDRAELLKNQFAQLAQALQKGMGSFRRFAEQRGSFVRTAGEVDEAWDVNREQLEHNIEEAKQATEALKAAEAKIAELIEQVRYVKVGKFLERYNKELYDQLLAQEV